MQTFLRCATQWQLRGHGGGPGRAALPSVAAVLRLTVPKADRAAVFAGLQVMEYAAVAELACTLNGTRNPPMSENLELRIRITADSRAAIEGTRQVESQIDRLGETSKQVGGLIAAYLSFEFLSSAVQALFQTGAALQDFQTRFQALAGSQQAAAAEMAYVQNAAQKLGIELNTARESLRATAGPATGRRHHPAAGPRPARRVRAGGADDRRRFRTSQTGHARPVPSAQLRKVSTEDFRQAVDPLPGMMKHVADAMGVSIGELKENLAKGKVGSADFAQTMIKGLQEAGKGAQDFGTGLSATWQRVQNEWTLLLEAFGAADFLSGSFNDMAGAILSTLEQTLKDASAFIQSGWLSDAFAAEVGYITGSWSELGSALADDSFSAMSPITGRRCGTTSKKHPRILKILPPSLAICRKSSPDSPSSPPAPSISGLSTPAPAGVVQIAFSAAWAAMQGWLAQILADMIAAVARAPRRWPSASRVRCPPWPPPSSDIPGVGDVMVGIVQQLGQARTAAVEWATTAQQGAAEVQTANAETAASYADQAQAVREAAAQQKVASEAAAQQTVLELHARTEARDAAIAKAQADRQAAAATRQQRRHRRQQRRANQQRRRHRQSGESETERGGSHRRAIPKTRGETAGLQRITQSLSHV